VAPSTRQLVAHPAIGTTTISMCSPMALSRADFEGARCANRFAVDVDRFLAARRSHADARLRADTRGRDGGISRSHGGGNNKVRSRPRTRK
jgi:hypothetical protein